METHHSTFQRIYNTLVGANERIEGIRARRFASLLSAFLLSAIPFANLTILFSDLLGNTIRLILIFTNITIFSIYLLSRTHYYKVTTTITTIAITIAPLLIWFLAANWQPGDISRIMPWIIIALAVGAFLTDERIVLIQAIVISSIMIFVTSFVQAIPIFEYDNHLLTIVILSGIFIIVSRVIDRYMREIEKQFAELEIQNYQ